MSDGYIGWQCSKCGALMRLPEGVTPGLHYRPGRPQRGFDNTCSNFGDPSPWKLDAGLDADRIAPDSDENASRK